MSDMSEVRFRVPNRFYEHLMAAASLHGMSVTAFVRHAVANEMARTGDYKRLTQGDVAVVQARIEEAKQEEGGVFVP